MNSFFLMSMLEQMPNTWGKVRQTTVFHCSPKPMFLKDTIKIYISVSTSTQKYMFLVKNPKIKNGTYILSLDSDTVSANIYIYKLYVGITRTLDP